MKTERDLFLEWLKKEYPMMYQWYSDGLEEWKTKVDYMFVAWIASAQRESYKLVPLEPTDEMINTGRIAKLETKGSLRQEYKAMIGASE